MITLFTVALCFCTPMLGAAKAGSQIIQLRVTEKGFEPNQIDVKPGTKVTLNVIRETDSTCATAIQISAQKIKKELPLNKAVQIDLGKLEKGKIRFACGMDMLGGHIVVN